MGNGLTSGMWYLKVETEMFILTKNPFISFVPDLCD